MGSSYDFLPNAVVGTSLGLASPCMGSTIALRRETLDEVGGFAAFVDRLADDYDVVCSAMFHEGDFIVSRERAASVS